MVDVMLIIPKYVMKSIATAKIDINERFNNFQFDPPLHVTYLAASLEKKGFSVKIIDEGILSLKYKTYSLVEEIRKESPIVIGIHVNSFSLYKVHLLIKSLKENSNAIVVIGGPHVNFDPYSVDYLDADYGFKGECELSFPKFVHCVKEKKSIEKIPGLIMKTSMGITFNSQELIMDLDSLPFPARHLISAEDYYIANTNKRVAAVLASRGCIYKCIFCSSPSKTIRKRSPENIIEEIKNLANQGYEIIRFQDDFFTFDEVWIKRICKLIIENDIKIKWDCTTRVDWLNLELLKMMKEAGCYLIFCGVETGNEKIRNKVLKKALSDENLLNGFRMIRAAGIQSIASVMIGHPTETLEDIRNTIKFTFELDPDYADFTLTTIIPGTAIFDLALKERKITKDEWIDISKNKKYIPIYIPDGMTLKQMQKIQKRAFFRFYYRPKVIFRELKNISSLREFSFNIKRAIQIISYFYKPFSDVF